MRLGLTWKMGRRPASPFRLRKAASISASCQYVCTTRSGPPLRVAGAQHVHAGLGVARRMLAVGLDPDRGGQLRCAPFAAAALDGNVILPRHLPVAFLEPSQLFQHLVVALRAALAGQPRVQRPDLRLEAFPPPCHDRLVLLLALLAPHPQVRLVPLAVDPPGLHRIEVAT